MGHLKIPLLLKICLDHESGQLMTVPQFTSKTMRSITNLHMKFINCGKLSTAQWKCPCFNDRQSSVQRRQMDTGKSTTKLCHYRVSNSFIISASQKFCQMYWIRMVKIVLQHYRENSGKLFRQPTMSVFYIILQVTCLKFLLRW